VRPCGATQARLLLLGIAQRQRGERLKCDSPASSRCAAVASSAAPCTSVANAAGAIGCPSTARRSRSVVTCGLRRNAHQLLKCESAGFNKPAADEIQGTSTP